MEEREEDNSIIKQYADLLCKHKKLEKDSAILIKEKERNEKLFKENEKLNKENEKIKQDFYVQNELINNLKNENERLKTSLGKKQKINSELKSKIEKLEKDSFSMSQLLENQKEKIFSSNDKMTEFCHDLDVKNKDIEHERNNFIEQKKQMLNNKLAEIKDLQGNIEVLTDDIKSMAEKIENMEKDSIEKEKQIEDLKSQLGKTQKVNSKNMSYFLQDIKEDNESIIENKKKKIAELVQIINDKEKEIYDLNKDKGS